MDQTSKKKKGELFFEKSTAFVIRFRVVVIILVLLNTAFFVSQIRNLGIDTSNEGFFHLNDPTLITYNEFRDQFGRDDKIAVAIYSEKIFTQDFLTKLSELHEELSESVPHLSDITSMINIRNTKGDGDILRVDDLLAKFPESDREMEAFKELVMNSPLYRNQIISEEGTFTSIIIENEVYAGDGGDDLLSGFDDERGEGNNTEIPQEYLSDEEVNVMVDSVQKIAAKYDSVDFRTFVAGTPVITQTVKRFMIQDMKRFLRLAVVTIGLCLFVMFRRVSGVIMPLLVVALTLVATLGIMSFIGTKFKTPTTILPSFLLAVGVGACVHALSLTYLNLRNGKELKDAIIAAYSHSGVAIVMTSLTTAAGLASFGLAKVAPIADLGIFSAVGVMIALVYTFTFLPALLSCLPIKKSKHKSGDSQEKNSMDRILAAIADFSMRRYIPILMVSGVIIIIGITGLFQVRFSHDVLTWLPKDLDVRKSTEIINDKLRGSVVLEMVLDTGKENGLYDKETLQAIDRLTTALESDYQDNELFVGKAISLTFILKEIHQALHQNNPDYYKVPENEKLIPQELLLFENSGSDDLEDSIDSQFRLARITLKVPWLDALLYIPFINDVEQRFNAEFGGKRLDGGEEMTITVTGIMSLLGTIFRDSIYSAAQSYGIAFIVITLMMIILIGELRLGLISMIPNLGPIIVVLGYIGWFSIPLNMFTMLVASIALGLSVDDTIHFMYNFRKYYEKSGDVTEAVRKSLNTAGRAMLTTTVVLAVGFFIFMFASMGNLVEFGFYTATATILALLGNFFMAPALLKVFVKSKKV